MTSGITSTLGLTAANGLSAMSQSITAVGTAYSLTGTPAGLVFGTTNPVLNLTAAGTYLIIASANVILNAATFAAIKTVTLKLRRTNNTAADLANGSITCIAPVVTLISGTVANNTWAKIYTTSNANDSITIFGDVASLPAAGSLDVNEASIIAIKL